MINFDTNLYERPLRAPIVDTFDLGPRAQVTASDLRDKWVPSMNRRHNKGEHTLLVIGHTRDGAKEEDQPTKVGLVTGPYAYHESWPGVDGPCMTGQHWVQKEQTVVCDGTPLKLSAQEILDRWPRRSAELWFSDHKIDPHCLLGATTPCRELGPLRLSRDGTAIVDRDISVPLTLSRHTGDEDKNMADEKKTETKADDKDTGVAKALEAVMARLDAMDKKIEMMGQAGAGGDAGAQHQLSPEEEQELEALLAQMHGGGEEGAPEPEPAPAEKPKKMSREAELEARIAKMELSTKLAKMGINVEADPNLIDDLAILPPDVQDRQIERLKLSRPAANAASLAGVVAAGNKLVAETQQPLKKIETQEQSQEIVKLAKQKGVTFVQMARELGYQTSLEK